LPHAPESAVTLAPLTAVAARGAPGRPTRRARRRESSPHAQPFLKWAGGKRQLLPELRRFYPADFGAYHEPFLGSGAVFFDLLQLGRLEGHRVVLSDTNPDVVGCCRALRDGTDAVITHLRRLARAHDAGGADHYYTVRDQRFNPARRRLLARHGAPEWPAYTPALAAMLIYLNRTGFNGLFRINSRGEFNVPAGRYVNPAVCDEGNLRRVAAAFARPGIELTGASFEAVLDRAQPGDFVYLDPPYAPLTRTARFTAYTADGFSEARHVLLQRVVVELARRGCAVVLSNSAAPLVHDLYALDTAARASGLRAHLVPVRRAINCLASRRSGVFEYVITNVPPATPARPS
jgi:DNA adenine methylase